MVWYSHLFQNFPEFVVIHIVKDLCVVNEADFWVGFPYFFYDPADVGNLISCSSDFSTSGSFWFTYC